MSKLKFFRTLGIFALLTTFTSFNASAQQIKTVFVIAMENHNWTQPDNQFTGGIQQVYQNPNAPFINSLVNGTAFATVDGSTVDISEQVAYASAYHNVLATPSGNNPHIHPSEPNYLWAEAGTNFGVLNDNDPFAAVGGTNQNTTQHLVTFLTQAGKTWKSYQEDIDLTSSGGQLTNVPLPQNEWTVPLASFSGNFAAAEPQFVRRAESLVDRSPNRCLAKNIKKMAPSLGPHFKRLRIGWVTSGKAIDTVPPAGTVREVTRRKSEGHGAEFAASLLP
jgi:Phosphoesterase family